jgi:DNA-binding transcriptional regulator YiaG
MRLTTNHPTSSYLMPVFVDSKNNPIDYKDAIKILRKKNNLTTEEFGDKLGVEPQTVRGWECGIRMPAKSVLLLIKCVFKI